MILPTPEDPGQSPIWENYLVAQVVQACLGQIPEHALAVGVKVAGNNVQLNFQLSEVTAADDTDIDGIVGEIEALVGPEVYVEALRHVVRTAELSHADGVRWIFRARP